MVSTEREWDLLEWLWKGWRDATGKKMPQMYTEYVSLQNEAAKLNGICTFTYLMTKWFPIGTKKQHHKRRLFD